MNHERLHNVWYSHTAPKEVSDWYNRIEMPFGLTLAGIALARVYIEYRCVNPSYLEEF